MPMAWWTYPGWRTLLDAKGCNRRRRGAQHLRVISITVAMVSRVWRFKIGVFQGSPLSPQVDLYQQKIGMEAVRPENTGFPAVLDENGKFRAATERHSDEAVMLAAAAEFVVRQLHRQDGVALRYKLRIVREKEQYLCIH